MIHQRSSVKHRERRDGRGGDGHQTQRDEDEDEGEKARGTRAG